VPRLTQNKNQKEKQNVLTKTPRTSASHATNSPEER
jgi:hypothetical protein